MKAVMMCETCNLPVFYDDALDEFTCPYCGEEYEAMTDEDVDMIINGMEHMLSFWAWNKVLQNSSIKETEK